MKFVHKVKVAKFRMYFPESKGETNSKLSSDINRNISLNIKSKLY